jgi:methylated-DNA-protein-cysteine methyltransferase-like protein
MSYGDVARLSGTHPRVVGWALHHNPDPKTIPCHRVVFRDGSLSPAFVFGGANAQKELLEREGVVFNGDKVRIL